MYIHVMPDEPDEELAKSEGGPPPIRAGVEDEWLAANVRERRTALGLSQGEIARRMADLGWPWYQQTVRRIEQGSRKAVAGEAQALARILGTTVDRLMMPGREASIAGLLEMKTHSAIDAWENIAGWTASLEAAQHHLAHTIAEAEGSPYRDSPLVAGLLTEARQVLALTAESAIADLLEDDSRDGQNDGGEDENPRRSS